MINVTFYGRGGQGVVTSAEVLAVAASFDNKFGQAIPSFGPERTGAPVVAFCRIDTKPIVVYQQVYHPDIVVVLDPSLIGIVDVSKGLKEGGHIIINSRPFDFKCQKGSVHFIDALPIAMEKIGKPFVNTAVLGAVSKIAGIVSLDALKKAIAQRFPDERGPKNIAAAERCYEVAK